MVARSSSSSLHSSSPASPASAGPQTSPNGRAKGKGKARRPSSAGSIHEGGNGTMMDLDSDGEGDFGPLQDYESALGSALALELDDIPGPSRAADEQQAAGQALRAGAQDGEEEEEFLYDGKDDEDTKELQQEARLHHQTYQERLSRVLGDDNDDDRQDKRDRDQLTATSVASGSPSVEEPNGRVNTPSSARPSFSTRPAPEEPPDATPASPAFSGSVAGPLSPPFSAQGEPIVTPRFPKPRLASSSSMESSMALPRYLPPRRPPMNPLVSRLRSTSGAPALSPSNSYRTVSHSSSLGSLREHDVSGRNGFANGSVNSSYIYDRPNAAADISFTADNLSRMSSGSNLNGLADPRIQRGHSPSPSDLFDSSTPSVAQSTASMSRQRSTATHTPVTEVAPFKWTPLRRIAQRMASPAPLGNMSPAPQNTALGDVTALAASGVICIGTSRGWALIFDYSQSLQAICGNEQIARNAGKVTAVAISSDQTFVAVGHATGWIYLYALAKPQVAARAVPPVSLTAVEQGKAEGHLVSSTATDASRILHIGFVGGRHTAIVSGDSNGLAFYHSLGKVLGLANTDVLRILGKYPTLETAADASGRAQQRLLAMQPLPLGTAEHPTDSYSLVALLTPAKLVVAGLKPSARTWWRAMNRAGQSAKEESKEANSSGVLAWLPTIEGRSPMLAFAWGSQLRIVRVEEEVKTAPSAAQRANGNGQMHNGTKADASKKEATVKMLRFRSTERPEGHSDEKGASTTHDDSAAVVHIAAEPILALQWLNQRTLLLLTSSQISVFDATTLQLIESTANSGLPRSLSFDQSLRTYKGRVFQFSTSELRVGSLLSWTDRILQLVDKGDLIAAIDLTISYFQESPEMAGAGDTLLQPNLFNPNLGLPLDTAARRIVVEPKLRSILSSSVEYVFSEARMRDATHIDPTGQGRGVDRTALFQNLVDASVRACLVLEDTSFLFDELYERYSAEGIEGIFLDRLEPFILEKRVREIPPAIVQQLLQQHEERGELAAAERLIWNVQPQYLDVNQAVRLCSKHNLHDALVYVYTEALLDFVGPLVELLGLVKQVQKDRHNRPRFVQEMDEDELDRHFFGDHPDSTEALVPHAYKVYAYLADTLVGLKHPSKEPLEEKVALQAKRSLYTFLFSGRPRIYPEGSKHIIATSVEEGTPEPTYPYLRLLLRFDAEAMLDCLDIALEDPYLNEEASGQTLDRQQIINLLLEVMGRPASSSSYADDFTTSDRTFLNIFVARSLPKYSQFVQLADPTLNKILRELASDSDLSTREDRQLAAEYLLSAHTPTYDAKLLASFEEAGFYRLLASIYRNKRLWRQLASVYIRDEEQEYALYEHLASVLNSASNPAEKEDVEEEILGAVPQMVDTDVRATAALLDRSMPHRHGEALQQLQHNPLRQLAYLRSLLEPEEDGQQGREARVAEAQKLFYLSLLCEHDSARVVDYLSKAPGLSREATIKICSERGAYHAVIWLHAGSGHVIQALDTLKDVLASRSEIMTAAVVANTGVEDLSRYAEQIVKSVRMATRICVEQSTIFSHGVSTAEPDDTWYALLASLVDLVRTTSATIRASPASTQTALQLQPVQALIPETLSSLISSTSSRTLAFPRLVRRLMTSSTASQSYGEYRDIIDSMLSAYTFESDLLQASNRLLSTDLFEDVAKLEKQRGTGWRPNETGVCEACGQAVWAVSKEESAFGGLDMMPKSSSGLEVSERMKKRPSVRRRPSLKGKEASWIEDEPSTDSKQSRANQGKAVVVFRGGAICHAACLYGNT